MMASLRLASVAPQKRSALVVLMALATTANAFNAGAASRLPATIKTVEPLAHLNAPAVGLSALDALTIGRAKSSCVCGGEGCPACAGFTLPARARALPMARTFEASTEAAKSSCVCGGEGCPACAGFALPPRARVLRMAAGPTFETSTKAAKSSCVCGGEGCPACAGFALPARAKTAL